MSQSSLLNTQKDLIAQLRSIKWANPTVISLLIANSVPLLGVLLLGWSTFAIVVIYWAENVIIGMINVLKMLICSPSQETLKLANTTLKQRNGNSELVQRLLERQSQGILVAHHASKAFFIPFFIFHYGLFCFGHGVFVFELLGGNMSFVSPFNFWSDAFERLREEKLLWAVGALAASHLFSFFVNFIYRGEFRRVTVPQLMFQPYGRIVILHIAILFGAILIQFFGSPIWMLVILVVGKTILDVGLHQTERAKNAINRRALGAPLIETEFAK